MKQHIGMLLQLVTLAVLPIPLFWDISLGLSHFLIIPMVLMAGFILFSVGTKLRES
jgi:hypothetical protein